MHETIEPAILYTGTPVVLISTLNEDGAANLAPMSSAWQLGWSCLLGLDASSKTLQNLRNTRECVLNFASIDMVEAVDRLALLTGSRRVPLHKTFLGYRSEPDKFAAAGLTPQPSILVKPPRVKECKLQMEARVVSIAPFAKGDSRMAIPVRAVEARILRVHADPCLRVEDHPNRIDPDKWRPLMMSFRRFYGLSDGLYPSRLAEGAEELYAPGARGGLRGVASKAIVRAASARYDVREPPELAPGPETAGEDV